MVYKGGTVVDKDHQWFLPKYVSYVWVYSGVYRENINESMNDYLVSGQCLTVFHICRDSVKPKKMQQRTCIIRELKVGRKNVCVFPVRSVFQVIAVKTSCTFHMAVHQLPISATMKCYK